MTGVNFNSNSKNGGDKTSKWRIFEIFGILFEKGAGEFFGLLCCGIFHFREGEPQTISDCDSGD